LPGIMLLNPPDADWLNFPQILRDRGFTVIVFTVDASITSEGISRMVGAFSQSDSVDPAIIGVVGAGTAADLALLGCAIQPLCDAVTLISPIGGQTLFNVMPDYIPRPLLIVVGEEDSISVTAANLVANAGGNLATLNPLPGSERGTELLSTQPELASTIIDWFEIQFSLSQ